MFGNYRRTLCFGIALNYVGVSSFGIAKNYMRALCLVDAENNMLCYVGYRLKLYAHAMFGYH